MSLTLFLHEMSFTLFLHEIPLLCFFVFLHLTLSLSLSHVFAFNLNCSRHFSLSPLTNNYFDTDSSIGFVYSSRHNYKDLSACSIMSDLFYNDAMPTWPTLPVAHPLSLRSHVCYMPLKCHICFHDHVLSTLC